MMTPAQNVHVLRQRRSRVMLMVIMVAAGLTMTGCYQRVVSESGPGSRSDVHEPNLKKTQIDRVIYGDEDD